MAKSKGMPLGTFLKLYSNEKQCEDRLVTLRWKDGYVCPKCGCHHANRLPNGRYQCAQCRHQVSVTAGTVLHKTHMPLRQWFLAFYFVCQDKRGISAKQLQLILGTIYKTAWYKKKESELQEKIDAIREELTEEQCEDLVMQLLHDGFVEELDAYLSAEVQKTIRAVNKLWEKYYVSVTALLDERKTAEDIMCPLSVIDYVVVHELSHITYKNHSPAFWARVKTVLPTYEDDQEWLKVNKKLMEII